jgi:hypothetical protein
MTDINEYWVPEVAAGLRPDYDKGRMTNIN